MLGALYLAYDLLGGEHGPLRTVTRGVTYGALFAAGYGLTLGPIFGLATGLSHGITLAWEYARGEARAETRLLDGLVDERDLRRRVRDRRCLFIRGHIRPVVRRAEHGGTGLGVPGGHPADIGLSTGGAPAADQTSTAGGGESHGGLHLVRVCPMRLGGAWRKWRWHGFATGLYR